MLVSCLFLIVSQLFYYDYFFFHSVYMLDACEADAVTANQFHSDVVIKVIQCFIAYR